MQWQQFNEDNKDKSVTAVGEKWGKVKQQI